ncbi:hypothetical protein C0J52_11404 [Blattella germanica]|nr:hypothetical protein C0J52_11404 [Blattella germanica]
MENALKKKGGDVLQETITANVSEDAVTLEFQRSDGTLITQLVDFRNMGIESSSEEEEDDGEGQEQSLISWMIRGSLMYKS